MTAATEVVTRFWEGVWSGGDADLLDEIFAPDIFENGEQVDIAAFKNAVTSWRRVIPDFTAKIEELVPLDDGRVLSRVTYTGTPQQKFFGLPPGKSFRVIGIDIFKVNEGRITELWHAVDHYDMFAQLGGKIVPNEAASE